MGSEMCIRDRVYHQSQYIIRRKVLKIFGAAFHIYDMAGNLAFYSKQKAFKLKEDIRIYGDQAMTSELLCIKARGVIDLGMTYDVIDSTTQQVVGSLRRKGLKSILRDSWTCLLYTSPSPRDLSTSRMPSSA